MKTFRWPGTLLFVLFTALLASCLAFESYTLKVDMASGAIECLYRDLTSSEVKVQGDRDPLEGDWARLQELLGKPFGDKEKKKGLEAITAKLFEDNGVLSGSITCRLAKPSAPLEERLAILTRLLDGQGTFSLSDGKIFLFTDEGKEMLSSNGKVINAPMKQAVVTWPGDAKAIEVTFRGASTRSLLPLYLKEQAKAK